MGWSLPPGPLFPLWDTLIVKVAVVGLRCLLGMLKSSVITVQTSELTPGDKI